MSKSQQKKATRKAKERAKKEDDQDKVELAAGIYENNHSIKDKSNQVQQMSKKPQNCEVGGLIIATALIEAEYEFKEVYTPGTVKKNMMTEFWEKHLSQRNSKRGRNSPESEKLAVNRESKLLKDSKVVSKS